MRRDETIHALAAALGEAAMRARVRIATAESCTGGLLAGAMTAIAGSSEWFERGFVTYSNDAKIEQVRVPATTIDRFGAVSEETARAMAEGALKASRAEWAVAVTGIAGPAGGSEEKPVGTVWFAWARAGRTEAVRHQFDGDRAAVREASVRIALEGLIDRMT